MGRPAFHLSFPVRDLALAKAFYCDTLGATVGRDQDGWSDIILFGHQLTLHERPGEVLSIEQRGVRHFGIILEWDEWTRLGIALQEKGCGFEMEPVVFDSGAREHGKFLLCDPSGNLVEIKAYRDVSTVTG